VAVDTSGNVLIADTYNDRFRVVAASTGTFYGQAMKAGDMYTISGNGTRGFSGGGDPGTTAELSYPAAMAVDAGNALIAGFENYRIREVAG
jgi:trimeric autotransporter adhesin